MTENEYRDRILESDLTAHARLVCLVLLQYRNRKTGLCYPSQLTLSRATALCENTVRRAVSELQEKGYLDIEKKRLSGNKYTSNLYHFGITPSCGEVSNEPSIDPSNEPAQFADKPIQPIQPNNSYGVYKNGFGGFKIENLLSDDAWMDARSHAQGWDIHHLAGIYNENINSGRMDRPSYPSKAFPIWCKTYTKGKRPS